MRMVLANGTVITASREENGDVFAAARVGLGALGIVTEITVGCVDLFKMRLQNIPMDLDTMLKQLPSLLQEHPRLQWFWTPYTPNATLVLRTPTQDPITGCWDDPSNEASRLAADHQGKLWAGAGGVAAGSSCVDVSYKTLTGSRAHYMTRSLYTEMEMFVPADSVGDAIADFRSFQAQVVARHNESVPLFTGVRYVAEDDITLSPQQGRSNAVISSIVIGTREETGNPTEFEMYGQGLEGICKQKYSGRPHWGEDGCTMCAKAFGGVDVSACFGVFLQLTHAVRPAYAALQGR